MTALVWIAMMLAAACAILGGVALYRLETPLERLHAGSFASSAAGFFVAVAAFAADGFTGRSLKIAFVFLIFTLGGAVSNHAVSRALLYRGGERR